MPLGEQLLQMSNSLHKINVYPMFQKDFHVLYVLALLQLIQFQFLISFKFFLPKKFGKRSGNSIEHFKMSKLLSFHRLKQLLVLKGKWPKWDVRFAMKLRKKNCWFLSSMDYKNMEVGGKQHLHIWKWLLVNTTLTTC